MAHLPILVDLEDREQYRKACPLPGHDHFLWLQRKHVQEGTGELAFTASCGRQRWFWVLQTDALIPFSRR